MIRGSIHRAVVASSSFLAAAATSSFFYFRIPLSPQADALVFSCRLLRVAWFTITIVGSVRYTQTTHHGCPSTHNSWCAYALRSASRPSSVPKTASEIRIETQITRVVVQNNTEIVRTKEQFKQWRSKTGGVYSSMLERKLRKRRRSRSSSREDTAAGPPTEVLAATEEVGVVRSCFVIPHPTKSVFPMMAILHEISEQFCTKKLMLTRKAVAFLLKLEPEGFVCFFLYVSFLSDSDAHEKQRHRFQNENHKLIGRSIPWSDDCFIQSEHVDTILLLDSIREETTRKRNKTKY